MISVVIPLYNKEQQIANTLRTVINQTFKDFEIIVVNDGSTDDSVAEVNKFSDPRIRLITQTNAGVSAARNRGIEEARGEYIALLDADDEWHPDYLATQLKLTETYPECDVFAVNYQFRDSKGHITPTIIRKLPFTGEHGVLTNYFEVASASHPPICSISIMARKEAFQSIGGFPIGIKSGEDLLTWARLACKYNIAYCKTPLATFINTPSDTTVSKSQTRAGGEEYVLHELIQLMNCATTKPLKSQIRSYVIRWYQIQSILMIENNQAYRAIPLCIDAIRLGGSIFTFIAISILGLLPPNLSAYLFKKIRR